MQREIKFRVWNKERKEWVSRSNLCLNCYGSMFWQFGYDSMMAFRLSAIFMKIKL